jgi:hypothetical protein
MSAKHSARNLNEALVWYHFVPASSPAGSQWYRSFRDSGAELLAMRIDMAVDALRKGNKIGGRSILDECQENIDMTRAEIDIASHEVLAEAVCGAEAYWQYRNGDLDGARLTLQAAQNAVVRALEAAPFLVNFTQKCKQLSLNEARVARSQCRFGEMWALIEHARNMVRGRSPLCIVRAGPVFVDAVYRWLEGLNAESSIEVEALEILRNPERTVALFDHLALDASLIPNVALDAF